jgi:hypothetical protein
MPSSPIRSNVLRRRLLVLLGAIFVLGLAIMAIDNMVQFDATATELSGYWLVQMLFLGAFAFIAPGYFASVWALRPLFRWLDDASSDRETTVAAARRATLRYPWLALVFFAGFGIFGSGLFHVTSALHEFGSLVATDPNWWPATTVVFANEFSISVALGIAFFAGARRLLRPFLAILPPSANRDGHARSLRLRILVITLALSLSTGVPILTLEFYGRYGLPVNGNEAPIVTPFTLVLSKPELAYAPAGMQPYRQPERAQAQIQQAEHNTDKKQIRCGQQRDAGIQDMAEAKYKRDQRDGPQRS